MQDKNVRDTKVKQSNPNNQIKNKNPAPVQITAEQILREANERRELPKAKPIVILADQEELNEYHQDKRKEFEDRIRANRFVMINWIKYGAWEENQGCYERARSVFERALDTDPRTQQVWLRYIEMEMKIKNVNRARNIFDRVVSFLPRVDVVWYKYVYMEEIMDNVAGARQVFERWMKWHPNEDAWMAYIKFERRYNEIENSRRIFKNFVETFPIPKNWIKWAKFEESLSNIDYARRIYEECIEKMGSDLVDQNVYVSFAKYETRMKEYERARAIYKFALEKLDKNQAANLYNEYSLFEKQFGDKEGIEDVVMTKRRAKYETDLEINSRNYDTWFDYIRLEEDVGNMNRIRDIYERAIAQVPLLNEKRFWRRYIYIWLFYATWEESIAQDIERTKAIYQKCIDLIPHQNFTFSKVWLAYAYFFIRQHKPTESRKLLGMSIGKCHKSKLFKGYIEMELLLRDFDRVRKLYEKFIENYPSQCSTWIKYAELEITLGDLERTRGIYELSINQPELDMPEVLWKSYIDFEIGEQEFDRARLLYERLLQKTEHVKVWISYAGFENNASDNGTQEQRSQKARELFQRSYETLKSNQLKEERMLLLESWKAMEQESGTETTLMEVESKMPRVVKKRRKIEVDGISSWEEYFDYIFPDDEVDKPNFKLLAMAHQWKLNNQQLPAKENV